MIKAGDKVKLTASIYDDGEDHHPPCWLAMHGEVLIVKEVYEKALAVHHEEVTDGSCFIIYDNEYDRI